MALTQVCSNCDVKQPLSQFNWRNKTKGTRHGICKACHKAYRRRHYLDNQEKYKAKARRWNKIYKSKRKDAAQRFVFEYLLEHPCVDCGETNPVVLEFDHVRGEKLASISYLVCSDCSIETIKAEIAKCDVRCANCHRLRTAKAGGWYLVKLYEKYQQELKHQIGV